MKTNVETPISPRIRAPKQDRSAVVEPPLNVSAAVAAYNGKISAETNLEICETPIAVFQREARAEFLLAAADYVNQYAGVSPNPSEASLKPIYLTGHQPQLFHPGVWFKNFACDNAARRDGATAINVVMDGDVISGASIRVPGGTASAPTVENVPFDAAEAPISFEERRIADFEAFRSFGNRAAEILRPLVASPLLNDYWPMVQKSLGEDRLIGKAFAQSRHQLELSQGLKSLELPQSRMCGLPSFRRFIAHLLSDLPRFSAVYNQAVLNYRAAHRIRSDAHPVPLLKTEGEWSEAPFWIWDAKNPRRRRLFVKYENSGYVLSDLVDLRLNGPAPAGSDGSAFVAALERWESHGVKIRSKALISTLWMRLFLSDLFIHGIGGANYDQVTDQIIRDFFQLQPPRFMVVSATLHLPVAREPFDEYETRNLKRALRDVDFRPERFYQAPFLPVEKAAEEVRRLIEEKCRWLETTMTVETAKARHRGIVSANAALAETLADRRNQLKNELEEALRRCQANAVLTWREYAFCLYPTEEIMDFFSRLCRCGDK